MDIKIHINPLAFFQTFDHLQIRPYKLLNFTNFTELYRTVAMTYTRKTLKGFKVNSPVR